MKRLYHRKMRGGHHDSNAPQRIAGTNKSINLLASNQFHIDMLIETSVQWLLRVMISEIRADTQPPFKRTNLNLYSLTKPSPVFFSGTPAGMIIFYFPRVVERQLALGSSVVASPSFSLR